MEYGIFNDDSGTHCADDAVESGFATFAEADDALKTRYSEDDDCYVHECEEEEEEDCDEE